MTTLKARIMGNFVSHPDHELRIVPPDTKWETPDTVSMEVIRLLGYHISLSLSINKNV